MFSTSAIAALAIAAHMAAPPAPQAPPSTKPAAPASQAAPQTVQPKTVEPKVAEPNPITHIFQNLGRDLKALPSRDNFYALAIGGSLALASHSYDDDVRDWVIVRNPSGESELGNLLGTGLTHTAIAFAVYGAGRWVDSENAEHFGSDLIRAQALNAVLTQVPKVVFNRTRPSGGSRSFPSGHSSAIFATATVVQKHYGFALGIPAFALGSFSAWSRVRSNHHWLSDIMMGGAVGVISGLTVTRGHKQTWSFVPVKTAGGAALYVVRR